MAKVSAYVYVMHEGSTLILAPGDDVPDGVVVDNPAAFADEDDDATPEPRAKILPAPAKKGPAKKADADS